MDATENIRNLLRDILWILPLACTPRVIYCAIKIALDSEESAKYKRRLLNLLMFVALAEGILQLLYIAYCYFTGGTYWSWMR